jgi:hypothetical protein
MITLAATDLVPAPSTPATVTPPAARTPSRATVPAPGTPASLPTTATGAPASVRTRRVLAWLRRARPASATSRQDSIGSAGGTMWQASLPITVRIR